jgi:pilus assembly protein CpaB
MNQRVSFILLIALVVAGGATWLVYGTIRAKGQSAPTTQVVVAARPLELGTLLKDVDLQMGKWAGAVPAGMATKKEGLIGRGVISPIYPGEPIMENRLAAAGAGGGLAATIPAGMRAVAVKVNEIVGVAGFAIPGMRVDVLITGTPQGNNSGAANTQVKTILQSIEVLSAGQNYQKDAEGKPVVVQVVNLLVTPDQAEVLSLASNETRLQLILRNPLDTKATEPPGTAMAALFGGAPAAAPKAPRPRPRAAVIPVKTAPKAEVIALPPYKIEVFNGAKQTEAKFERPVEEKK